MFRTQYDSDATTWSPQGRLMQVEYAMEAVQQGSACLGIVGKGCVVLAAVKRTPSELAEYQQKLLRVDDHLGIAISGLNADARKLAKYMRTECLQHKYVYGTPMHTQRLVLKIADKSQTNTQQAYGRPYGIGLLVGACDQTGPHLFQTCPSGNYYEYMAHAIGARSQAAKTYLEKHFESFASAELDELIKHGLKALANSVGSDKELDKNNASISVVGTDSKWRIIEGDELQPYLDAIELEGDATAMADE